jgi:hypothetical protein
VKIQNRDGFCNGRTRWDVNPQERKLKQRIVRRKEKVQRLNGEQEAHLAVLDAATFLHQQDYFKAASMVRKKLYHLEQELLVLESGWLMEEV